MIKSTVKVLSVGLLALSMLSACGGGKETADSGSGSGDDVKVSSEPVQLLVYSNFPETADDFDEVFVKPVRAKYPNISLKLVTKKSGHPTITEQVATGEVPDLMIGTILNLYEFQDVGLFYDMTPLIKKYKFDVNRIEPAMMEEMKQYSEKGEIYGLPYTAILTRCFTTRIFSISSASPIRRTA